MIAWSPAFRSLRHVFMLLPLVVLAACSNNDDHKKDNNSTPPPPPAPVRGQLVTNPAARTASISSTDVLGLITASSSGQQLLQLTTAPKCGIDVHKLVYYTVDPKGASIQASAAMMVPTGTNASCTGARPIVIYAHGTQVEKSYDIGSISNPDNAEGLLIAAVFAAQGYIVVAPNYAGFDVSTLNYHPYLNADQQSKDVTDSLIAAKSSLPTSAQPQVTYSTKLFITGYSQGGYVAMATHRLMQQTGVAVTASAPMSGPYAVSAFGDAVFEGRVMNSAPILTTLLVTSYQKSYGDIYTNPAEVYEAAYAPTIDTLLPTAGKRSDIFTTGKLPVAQLFSATPPDPAYAAFTPATSPAFQAAVYAAGFGPMNLVTNAYRLAYLQDATAHPDGGFPTVTDNQPPATTTNTLRKAFKLNDLRNWMPTSPVLLCGGNGDPTVFYMNTQLMQSYWTAAGVTAAVKVLDVDDSPSLNDPFLALKAGFAVAKNGVAAAAIAGGATDNGAAAINDAYHATLVPPFCLTATRQFFDGL